jgi:hypothetical protein
MGPRHQVFDPTDLLKTGLLLFGLISLIAIGFGVLQLLRKAYLGPDDGPGDVMEAIQAAHEAGQLDDAEYQRARASVDRAEQGPPETPEVKPF